MLYSTPLNAMSASARVPSEKKEVNATPRRPLMSLIPLFTTVLDLAQNRMLLRSEVFTSAFSGASPASSNFRIVPETDCH